MCISTCRSSSSCLLPLDALLKEQTVDFSLAPNVRFQGGGERRVDVAAVGRSLDLDLPLCPLSTPPSHKYKAVILHSSAVAGGQTATFDPCTGRSGVLACASVNMIV